MTRLYLSLFTAAAVAVTIWAFAAGDDPPKVDCSEPEAEAITLSYSAQIQPIFDFNCVVCHQTGAANAGLNLETGVSHEQLVERKSTQSELKLVEPGKLQDSYLYHKLKGTHLDVGGSGASMPLGGAQLPEGELELITTWIQECALDN